MTTHRERVLTALDHREPDRPPIDLNGHRSSGIMVQAYRDLRRALGLPSSPLYIYDFIQQLAIVEDDVLDRFGVDVVELGHDYANRPEYWQDWELQDGTPVKIPAFIEVVRRGGDWVVYNDRGQVSAIQKAGCLYFEQATYPLQESTADTFPNLGDDLNQISWWRIGSPPAPAGLDAAGLEVRRRDAAALRTSTDRAIYGIFGGNLLETGQMAYRNDVFLELLAGDPSRAHAFLDGVIEIHLANLEKFLGAVGEYIDVIGFGDDLGMQMGPQISPRMYRAFFKPRHAAMWRRVKELAPRVKICLHCCGGVHPLLGDLIDAGLDAINPVQINCADMEPWRLKRDFGKDIVFWGGGCDTRYSGPDVAPEAVTGHVRANLDIWSPGGGYVFQHVHNIMANVPSENVIAMFDAVIGR